MPPTTRKRSRGAATTTTAVEKPRNSGKKQKQNPGQPTNDLQAEPINLGVAEPPQASRGNRYVDFETILTQTNALNAPEVANAATETVCAKQATENIFKAVLGNDDLEVVRCGGDDLSVHIPKPIIDKIWTNQYININLLLKGSVELHELCSGGTLKVSDSGILEKHPKFSKEKVPNLDKWTDAFVIFMSIYFKKNPQKVQELLQ